MADAGLIGARGDSVVGATLQAADYSSSCKDNTERPAHHCRTPTSRVRGHQWCANDTVNLLGTSLGAAMTIVVLAIIHRGMQPNQVAFL
jgi:uncharacterized membrane protein